MLNSDAFLDVYSELEKWLRSGASKDRSISFYELVDRMSRKNAAVRRHKDDLKEYADLRNAIIHERTDSHVIAEPNNRALEEFRRIRTSILQPPKVIPQFQRSVKSRVASEAVGRAVSDMRDGSFSQIPVLDDGNVVALLTAETVVRWLASEVSNDLVSLMDTEIRTVLDHVEDEDHYCFLEREATLHEAVSRFEEFTSRGKKLDAILITESGQRDQKMLGILTVYDLPAILESLGLRRMSAA